MKKNNSATAEKKLPRTKRVAKDGDQPSVFKIPDPAQEGEYLKLPIAEIDPSPFNHRKIFPAAKMEELAASVGLHGIIENLVVRRMPSGRYELVAGERRLRAAQMAGLKEVPVIVRALTDEQVREIQLAENLQREDPHPLEEAEAIRQLQTRYKTLDEVTLRLGKSKSFVYSRLKLLSLIPEIREMFIAEKFNLRQVLPIAELSADSQSSFYKEYCRDWKEQERFNLPGLDNILSQYLYSLHQAPFNPKDKNLLPEVGSCTKCPFNSTATATLFPEEYQRGICRKGECFQRKCLAQVGKDLLKAVEQVRPVALLFYGSPSQDMRKVVESTPELSGLPVYNYYGITVIHQPDEPQQDDYIDEGEDGEGTEPDEEAYAAAMEDYREEREKYEEALLIGKILKGLKISYNNHAEACEFIPESRDKGEIRPVVTAAAVQAAIKEGKATPELLQGEIDRIRSKEERSKELDAEKVQLNVHAAVSELVARPEAMHTLTEADLACARLLIFQSLSYSATDTVRKVLSLRKYSCEKDEKEAYYEQLRQLTDAQFSYLIRLALADKAESKNPRNDSGYFLYRMAEGAGIDTRAIRLGQDQIAATRQGRQQEKIEQLQKKMGQMQVIA